MSRDGVRKTAPGVFQVRVAGVLLLATWPDRGSAAAGLAVEQRRRAANASAKTKGKLITTGTRGPAPKQLTKPCGDCPWRVDALPGWLGGFTPEEWSECVHSDARIQCHVHNNVQCAGAAIHRANMVKMPRDPDVLRLPADRAVVFATTQAFRDHHAQTLADWFKPDRSSPATK